MFFWGHILGWSFVRTSIKCVLWCLKLLPAFLRSKLLSNSRNYSFMKFHIYMSQQRPSVLTCIFHRAIWGNITWISVKISYWTIFVKTKSTNSNVTESKNLSGREAVGQLSCLSTFFFDSASLVIWKIFARKKLFFQKKFFGKNVPNPKF